MTEPHVELVYFVGCPNADTARARLRSVLPGGGWREWNLADAATPDRYRRFGSPTILVDGRDVVGDVVGHVVSDPSPDAGADATRSADAPDGKPTPPALACRVGGAPTPAQIRAALAARS